MVLISDKEKNVEKKGSLKQVKDFLAKMEIDRKERFLAAGDVKLIESEEDPEFDRLWESGNIEGFVSNWRGYGGKLESELNTYINIIKQPNEIEYPTKHLIEGRRFLISLMRHIHKIYFRLVNIRSTEIKKIVNGNDINLSLSWMMKFFYCLGDNFEKTGETQDSIERFIIYSNLWLQLPPESRYLNNSPMHKRYYAWETVDEALIELVNVLNALGIDACGQSQRWKGMSYFKRSQMIIKRITPSNIQLKHLKLQTIYYLTQGYSDIGAIHLGFRYGLETIRLQHSKILDRIDTIIKSKGIKTPSSQASAASESGSVNAPTLSLLLPVIRSWISSIEGLTVLSLGRESYVGAEFLFHVMILLLKQLRSEGNWEGREETELSELQAIVHFHLIQYLVERMRKSSELINETLAWIWIIKDNRNKLNVLPSIDINNPNNKNDDLIPVPFSIELTKFPPKGRSSPSDSSPEDLKWIFFIKPKYDECIQEFVDVLKVEDEDRIALGEMFNVASDEESIRKWIEEEKHNWGQELRILVNDGIIGFMLTQVLDFGTIGEEALQLCGRLNAPFLNCEFKKNENGELRRLINSKFSVYESDLNSVVSPFLCLNQSGMKQLQRLVNHYAELTLEHFKFYGWKSNHTETIWLQSLAYGLLASNEPDPDTYCIIQNRRLKLLSPLLKRLNPNHYNDSIKGMSFECGEICEELLNIKMSRKATKTQQLNVTDITHLTAKTVRELHKIRRKGIHYFTIYIESLKREFNGSLPDPLPVPYWNSYFAARIAIMQFGNMSSQFADQFEPFAPIMVTELTEALNICREVQEDARRWEVASNPEVAIELHLAELNAKFLPVEIDRVERILKKSGTNAFHFNEEEELSEKLK